MNISALTLSLRFRRTWLLLIGLAIFFGAATSLRAQYQTLWQIGIDDDPIWPTPRLNQELGQETPLVPAPGGVTRLPQDPLFDPLDNPGVDQDFYEAGLYPPGFNGLSSALSVPFPEPDSTFDSGLSNYTPTNRVHFILNADQAGPLARLRLSFELAGGASITNTPIFRQGDGFGAHDIVVQFKSASGTNTLVAERIESAHRFIVDFSAASVQATAGPNTIEFARPGPIVPHVYTVVNFDYVKLEADPGALLDADGDGLPRWWEEDHHLSDTNPLDAASDLDHDGLTALQEYNGGVNSTDPNRADTDGDGLTDGQERALGSNPLLKDTDGDGLSDGDEVKNLRPSSPLLADSDGDGTSDSLERRAGTDPLSAASASTVFRGGIAIHFVSRADPEGTLGANEAAGIIPQTHWNETVPLSNWTRPAGSAADIASPVPGKIVRSDGVILPNFSLSWTADGSDANYNKGSSDGKVMDGLISASGLNAVTVTLGKIPFARYDLYAVVGGIFEGQQGRVRLGASAKNDRYFQVTSTPPITDFLELRPRLTNFQRGNFVCYTNQTAKNATLTVASYPFQTSIGLHAIQIVDRTLDADKSGIPDWYELKYGLGAGSRALSAADSDGDGLSNLKEYQLRTDPHKFDTDGDGLSDGQERALKTNPLLADTDGDGTSDGQEVHGAIPTNPKLADSDRDKVSDWAELRAGSDPLLKPGSPVIAGLPYYRAGPASWEWTYDNVQIVWNHRTGGLAPDVWNEDNLVTFRVANTTSADWGTFIMGLKYFQGSLSYMFVSEWNGGFSYPEAPGVSLIEAIYHSPIPDLQKPLGFSGFGDTDISDRLRFQLKAQRGPAGLWNLTFEIRNLTSNSVVVTKSYTNCTADPTLANGTAQWREAARPMPATSIVPHQGTQLFFSLKPLTTWPAFAAAKDSDKDGMPDVWETAHGFNKFDPADALADADGDGLSNRDEFLAGTDPRNPDTDRDGVSDAVERAAGSDPLDPNSTPAFAGFNWPSGQELPIPPGASPDGISRAQAARFLQQASFGPTSRELDRVQRLGFRGWLDDQMLNQPMTLHRAYQDQIYADLNSGHTDRSYLWGEATHSIDGFNSSTSFARAAIAGSDQLRQRVAFALSQILVVSRRDPHFQSNPRALLGYYDLFVRNAFGNYHDLLRKVTFHPVMGAYLSHLGNQQAHPEIHQYPDENFAREVMQLFSIGLWQLNTNGLRKLDDAGQPIPTYNNRQITEFARVFTGFWFGGQRWGVGGWEDSDYFVPMDLWVEKHDFGRKTLLDGFVVPARPPTVENAVLDVDDALLNIFDHPNTAPFLSRQLIQFLVTSNPSSNYVARVAAVFADNGAGVRGDLGAVVRGILLDDEARGTPGSAGGPEFGRLKDPLQRAMGLARIERLAACTNLVWWMHLEFDHSSLQEPLNSISVFNFYRPDYQPPGLLAQAGLVAPAFQILDGYTAIAFPNKLWEITEGGLKIQDSYSFPPDYSALLPYAADPLALLDQLNVLFCGGSMSSGTHDILLAAVQQLPPNEALARVRLAVYLAVTSPDGAIQR